MNVHCIAGIPRRFVAEKSISGLRFYPLNSHAIQMIWHFIAKHPVSNHAAT